MQLRAINCKRILASCKAAATRSIALGRAMDLKSHIGIRMKSARRRAGLTQEQLSEAVDKAVETISNIERGHSVTGVETLEQIAKALGTPVSYFFEDFPHKRRITPRRAELQQQHGNAEPVIFCSIQ